MFGMAVIAALGFAGSALAQPIVGVPHDWQMNFPPPYTPVMEKVESLNDLLLVIITLICVFVLGLLLYAMWRFHASRNPVATTTTHNTVLEIAWTVVPILILVIIAIPSFRLLYYADKAVDAAFTIKVTGNQWYWTYEYPDQGNFTVESRILPEADRIKQKPPGAAPAGGRRGDGDPQGHHGPHHRHRRRQLHARLDRAGLRHQEDRDPRPPQRGLDQRQGRGLLLRPVLADLRRQSQPTCRSRCAWSPRTTSTNGWSRRRRPPGLLPATDFASATAPANR